MEIYIKKIGNKGRGVFANKVFKNGEIIEICHVIILDEEDTKKISETELDNYCFKWDEDLMTSAICLGNGSLYNHSDNPNSLCDPDLKNDIIRFIALKNINKDEEITHNYDWEQYNWSLINKKNKHI